MPHDSAGRPRRQHDRRYGSRRWRAVRLRVLIRDGYVCRVVKGCPTIATVADHVIPVYPGMPDALFFGEGNLRAGCRHHNIARGFATSLAERTSGVVAEDYS